MRPLYVRWGRCLYCQRWYAVTSAGMIRQHKSQDLERQIPWCRGTSLHPAETSYEERKPRNERQGNRVRQSEHPGAGR